MDEDIANWAYCQPNDIPNIGFVRWPEAVFKWRWEKWYWNHEVIRVRGQYRTKFHYTTKRTCNMWLETLNDDEKEALQSRWVKWTESDRAQVYDEMGNLHFSEADYDWYARNKENNA